MTASPDFQTTGYATPDAANNAACLYMAEWDNGYTDFVIFAYEGIYGTLYEVAFTRPAQVAA